MCMSTKNQIKEMIDGNKSFEKKVVVYSHLLASWQSHCADKNSWSVDATNCDIQRINGLEEIS